MTLLPDSAGPAPLEIAERAVDGVSVVTVAGQLDLASAPTLCARVEAQAGRAAARIVLDLTGLEFCDSTGLRALAGVADEIRVRTGRLVIIPPAGGAAARTFDIAGAGEFLRLAPDRDRGVAALRA